jgi:hypothetical protein
MKPNMVVVCSARLEQALVSATDDRYRRKRRCEQAASPLLVKRQQD